VAKRRVFSTELGRYFAEIREAHGWTQRQAEDIATRRGLEALGRQTLWRLETGKVKFPSRETLRDFAELFDVPYDELVGVVVRHTYQVGPSAPESGLVNVRTNDGLREVVSVPLLDGRIAAGEPLAIHDLEILDHLSFPPALIEQLGVTPRFAKCVRVGHREMSMFPTIKPDETVLLDCSDSRRDFPVSGRIYAVNVEEGSTLKRIVLGADGITLHSDNLDKATYPMRTITFDDDTRMRNIIVGEAAWAGGALL
jgi:transcriptional regulator with XRE-family HTH domain